MHDAALGIFTLLCRHGICYGFHIMDQAESPRTPFALLMARFENGMMCIHAWKLVITNACTAPDIFVYDNCCHLAEYAYNREPNFFRNTLFLIDRYGHASACMD